VEILILLNTIHTVIPRHLSLVESTRLLQTLANNLLGTEFGTIAVAIVFVLSLPFSLPPSFTPL
jgi:hypothetical protein